MSVHTLLDSVDSTGAGTSIILNVAVDVHGVEVTFVGTITALVIDLEESYDLESVTDANATWFQLQRHTFTSGEITAKAASFKVVNAPARRLRANLITATGIGGSDLVSARYEPGYIGGIKA